MKTLTVSKIKLIKDERRRRRRGFVCFVGWFYFGVLGCVVLSHQQGTRGKGARRKGLGKPRSSIVGAEASPGESADEVTFGAEGERETREGLEETTIGSVDINGVEDLLGGKR